MTTTETRLLPKSLVNDCHRALARLRFCRNVDREHLIIPKLPHPVDCDVCTAGRQVDMALDEVLKAIGHAPKVSNTHG